MLESATYRAQVANRVPTCKFEIQAGNLSRGRIKDRRGEAFSPLGRSVELAFQAEAYSGGPICINNRSAQLHEDLIAERKTIHRSLSSPPDHFRLTQSRDAMRTGE